MQEQILELNQLIATAEEATYKLQEYVKKALSKLPQPINMDGEITADIQAATITLVLFGMHALKNHNSYHAMSSLINKYKPVCEHEDN